LGWSFDEYGHDCDDDNDELVFTFGCMSGGWLVKLRGASDKIV
jgi:hypothetical protein